MSEKAPWRARLTREGGRWLLQVDGVGSTLAGDLEGARRTAEDLIAAVHGLPDPLVVVTLDLRDAAHRD